MSSGLQLIESIEEVCVVGVQANQHSPRVCRIIMYYSLSVRVACVTHHTTKAAQ
jgi:hypothetical protein